MSSMNVGKFIFVLIVCSCLSLPAHCKTIEADVCVYGSTSGAVTAAIKAASLGKKTILISPHQYLGGMSSNGLGWSDTGDVRTIGGMAREFYSRIYDYYQEPNAWKSESIKDYTSRIGSKTLGPNDKSKMMFTFEPHAARIVFESWVKDSNVVVITGRLDRNSGAVKSGTRIVSIATLEGDKISAKMFIDATYEGDLLAAAGVKYRIGREGRDEFSEGLAGIYLEKTINQIETDISPYKNLQDPNSGLIYGVEEFSGRRGESDGRLQAYCYRLCLTNDPKNIKPIEKPQGYREEMFEVMFRLFEAGKSPSFKLSAIANKKTDSNNSGGFSFDFLGGNYSVTEGWNYAEADYEKRRQIEKAHEDYQRGLIWTLQNHPRVPERERKKWRQWGLAKDEFTENDNWPEQIYVREARRMVGQLVMTQQHIDRAAGFETSDPVCMGSYNLDSHNVRRVVWEKTVKNEGEFYKPPAKGPYPISFRAIIPKNNDAENLLVTFCISSTHTAFGSIRMEPVTMMIGQAAGTAAALCIDNNCSVQNLPYDLLKDQLFKDGQILDLK